MDDINTTLVERGSRYGPFNTHAEIAQTLKIAMSEFTHATGYRPWHMLTNSQREALDMIMHKVGRILNGDPNYADSWVDIAGYATLVAKELEGKQL